MKKDTIWCYTTDPATPWEYCDVIYHPFSGFDKSKLTMYQKESFDFRVFKNEKEPYVPWFNIPDYEE